MLLKNCNSPLFTETTLLTRTISRVHVFRKRMHREQGISLLHRTFLRVHSTEYERLEVSRAPQGPLYSPMHAVGWRCEVRSPESGFEAMRP